MTIYYPILETRRYADVAAMCAELELPEADVRRRIDCAVVAGFEAIIVRELPLDDPELQMFPAVLIRPGEPVIVGVVVLSAASADPAEVEARALGAGRGMRVHIARLFVDFDRDPGATLQ